MHPFILGRSKEVHGKVVWFHVSELQPQREGGTFSLILISLRFCTILFINFGGALSGHSVPGGAVMMSVVREMLLQVENSRQRGDFPTVQWLKLYGSTAGGTGSISGLGSRILHALLPSQKKIFFLIFQTKKITSCPLKND